MRNADEGEAQNTHPTAVLAGDLTPNSSGDRCPRTDPDLEGRPRAGTCWRPSRAAAAALPLSHGARVEGCASRTETLNSPERGTLIQAGICLASAVTLYNVPRKTVKHFIRENDSVVCGVSINGFGIIHKWAISEGDGIPRVPLPCDFRLFS